ADLSVEYPGVNDPFMYRRTKSSIAPCVMVDGDPPILEDVRIGASDLRILRVASDTDMPGGLQGTLTITDDGVTGTFVNNTGETMFDPRLYCERNWYTLEPHENFTYEVKPNIVDTRDRRTSMANMVPNYARPMNGHSPYKMEGLADA